jgi:hypothetical protein
MRFIGFASLLALAACSDGAGKDETKAADKSKLQLAAGQWETVSEVTNMTSEDQGAPAIKAETGSKTTTSNCVGEAEGKKPPAATLAGLDNASCEYQNIYMSKGRLNASMICTRPGLSGNILVSTQGTYTDKSFELTSNSRTMLATDGDISFDSRVTGRHTGACTPAAS